MDGDPQGLRQPAGLRTLTDSRRAWRYAAVCGVFAALMMANGAAMAFLVQKLTDVARARFAHETAMVEQSVGRQLQLYAGLLDGVRGLYAASRSVGRDEFAAYLRTTNPLGRYPGLKAVWFVERVTAVDRGAYLTRMRADTSVTPTGYPAFAVHPPGDWSEAAVVTCTEPRDVGDAALGFDLWAEPVRRQALEIARDTGQTTASGPVALRFGAYAGETGVLLTAPIYRNGAPYATVSERRAALVGYATGTFRPVDILQHLAATPRVPPTMGIRVVDHDAAEGDRVLCDRAWEVPIAGQTFQNVRTLSVLGRRWTILCRMPAEALLAGLERWMPVALALGGSALSILVTWLFAVTAGSRDAALRLAARMAAQVRERETQLIQADRLSVTGQLAAGMAHEVKNPLGIVIGGVEYLETRAAQDDAELREALHKVKAAAVRAGEVIQRFLNFSRPSFLRLAAITPAALIRETLELLAYRVPLQHIRLQTRYGEGVTRRVQVDAHQIQQVLSNVLLNAIEAMPQGGRLSVSVSSDPSADVDAPRCAITVADTGTGIAPADLPRLSEPFFTTKQGRGGTGLGLSISKTIVERHGGAILLASEPGQGTQVTIMLPWADAVNRPKGGL